MGASGNSTYTLSHTGYTGYTGTTSSINQALPGTSEAKYYLNYSNNPRKTNKYSLTTANNYTCR